MAETAQKIDVANKSEASGEETPSMEEILKSIRGVISGEEGSGDDDILELTDMAEEPSTNAATAVAEAPMELEMELTTESEPEEKSVLDEIDSVLEEESAPKPEEAVAEVKAEEPKEEPKEEVKAAVITPEDDVLEVEVIKSVSDTNISMHSETDPEHLITDRVAEESAASLKAFMNNIPKTHIDSPISRGGATLEDLVIEAMRPFLAQWLNENLPTIVRQIVTKEIKKLIPKEDED